MATNPRFLTADDVLDLPVPDGAIGYELVNGQPVPVMPASQIHGRLIIKVGARLESYVTQNGLAGVVLSDSGFVLGLRRDPQRMRGPDVSYVSRSRLEGQDPERLIRGVPDLAVEIDLTSGKKPGGQQRILEYLEAGVRLAWAIDPHSRSAMIYHPDGSARLVPPDGALDGEDVLPGFRLPLSDLFA